MTVETHRETLGFQTEVRQLLDLMIHSLYSNKEIFLRELISNASDACDKLRFEALTDDGLYEGDSSLAIRISVDPAARTVTVADNGIGMSRAEVVDNIGTIARSGTRQFMSALSGEGATGTSLHRAPADAQDARMPRRPGMAESGLDPIGDKAKDLKLIGQFGVGFYSSFIVADRVTIVSRRAGLTAEHGVRWQSDGKGEYTIETVEKPTRGTEVTLHMREGEDELLDGSRLRSIVHKYSDHISLPVLMPKEGGGEAETVNRASALWARPKNAIKAEEYDEFYRHVAHDFEPPLAYTHNRVEGKQEYISLLFIPARAPFDLWDRDRRHGIKLYVRRVFIMDDAEQLMPNYLRFVRGVVDSGDLPLNVSREILQQSRDIETIRAGSVRKVLDLLDDLAGSDAQKYVRFWSEFGRVLKEGVVEDVANRGRIARLLRFASTHADQETQDVSLADYVARMKPGQKAIYFVTADSFAAARSSPHLEIFRKKGIEVLLLSDRVDEWVAMHLTEFEGKPFVSVTKGGLDLGELEDEQERQQQEKAQAEYKELVERVRAALGEQVQDVRITHRLTSSPACLIADDQGLSANLERILREAGQKVAGRRPILELNPAHPIVQRLRQESDQGRFGEWSRLLHDQARLAEGGELDDPAGFVGRLNGLLLELMQPAG